MSKFEPEPWYYHVVNLNLNPDIIGVDLNLNPDIIKE